MIDKNLPFSKFLAAPKLNLIFQELKQCYQCAGKDTKEDTGEHCDQELSYSMQLVNDENGLKDVRCTNQEGSCRWRICQCDRNFAQKLRKQVRLIFVIFFLGEKNFISFFLDFFFRLIKLKPLESSDSSINKKVSITFA